MSVKALTLCELQLSIKGALSEKFPLAVWVTAEIADLKVNYSGHCYIELIEKGDRNTTPKAQSRAVIWRSSFAMISSHFRSQTGQELGAGLKVLIKVLVNYHEIYGLSLQITDIDPTYTLGDAERQRQMTIEQLKKDGVWDMNRELPMPNLLQRIAVVSSANAAGYQDFCQEIARSGYYFSLTLFDAFMQGAGAEESIISALEQVANSDEQFDAVVIIRGGGSTTDLQCFDGYRIASHVAQFPVPIISGIGHDKDVSVVDMVAAQSLKTPTAVATMLTERMSQHHAWLEGAALMLHDAAASLTRNHLLQLEQFATDLKVRAEQKIESEKSRIETLAVALPERVEQFISQQNSKLDALQTATELHSPSNLLRLGFAVARLGDVAVRSSEQITVGDDLFIEIADAQITTQVQKIEKR